MKTRSILAFALTLIALASAATATAVADTGEAGSSLSVGSWSGGLFGTLKAGEDGCTAGRRVLIFERTGQDRDPSQDRQVEVTHTADGAQAGDWSTRGGVGDPGRYYAEAPATERCAKVTSEEIRLDRGERGDSRGDSANGVPICGEWNHILPPEQLDECRIAYRVSVASCGGKHLGDDTKIDCDDADGIPCLCQIFVQLRFPGGDRERTYARVQTRVNPFATLEAEGLNEASPSVLYARYVGGGNYKNIYPPEGEPGQPGGPLLISEDAAGTSIRIEGIVYKR